MWCMEVCCFGFGRSGMFLGGSGGCTHALVAATYVGVSWGDVLLGMEVMPYMWGFYSPSGD